MSGYQNRQIEVTSGLPGGAPRVFALSTAQNVRPAFSGCVLDFHPIDCNHFDIRVIILRRGVGGNDIALHNHEFTRDPFQIEKRKAGSYSDAIPRFLPLSLASSQG
jgi:hypothetical protein